MKARIIENQIPDMHVRDPRASKGATAPVISTGREKSHRQRKQNINEVHKFSILLISKYVKPVYRLRLAGTTNLNSMADPPAIGPHWIKIQQKIAVKNPLFFFLHIILNALIFLGLFNILIIQFLGILILYPKLNQFSL